MKMTKRISCMVPIKESQLTSSDICTVGAARTRATIFDLETIITFDPIDGHQENTELICTGPVLLKKTIFLRHIPFLAEPLYP